jgi:hypothetical protein
MNIEKLKTLPAWLILALSASLLRFKVRLQSDTLFLDDLFTDLLSRSGRWAEWKFSSAPAFFPDMLLYFLSLPIFHDPATRIFAVSAAQVFLLAAALLWCARQIDPALSSSARTSILLLLALFTLASAQSGMWLFFYTTNNHLASLLFGLTGAGLMLRHIARRDRASAALLIIGSALALVSTALFTLSFMLPVLLLLAAAWVVLGDPGPAHAATYQPQRRTMLRLGGMLVAAQVLATLLSKVLIRNVANEGRVHASPETAGVALHNFLLALKTSFKSDNWLTMSCSVLLLLALLYLAYRLLRAVAPTRNGVMVSAAEWRFGAAAALLCVVLPVNLAGVILSGGFADPFGMRYLMFPLTLALLLAVILLARASAGRPWPARVLQLTLGGVIAVNAGGLTLRPPPVIVDDSELAAGCLARIQGAGFALHAGIADYWNGRGVSYLLAHRNPILVTDTRLAPDFHVSTLGPLVRPRDYPRHDYNFAVLYGGVKPVNPDYTAAAMRAVLPGADRIESCADGRLEIWLYQDQRLDQAVKQAGAAFLRNRQAGR